ncbi:MAG: flagellar hook-length control protein FliK [Yoonia sp.]|uniref:flagellar hook-length control protein FliK n=1 Tax=Yoonia sp. TaxID=2212373 RepID=UPI003EF9FA77
MNPLLSVEIAAQTAGKVDLSAEVVEDAAKPDFAAMMLAGAPLSEDVPVPLALSLGQAAMRADSEADIASQQAASGTAALDVTDPDVPVLRENRREGALQSGNGTPAQMADGKLLETKFLDRGNALNASTQQATPKVDQRQSILPAGTKRPEVAKNLSAAQANVISRAASVLPDLTIAESRAAAWQGEKPALPPATGLLPIVRNQDIAKPAIRLPIAAKHAAPGLSGALPDALVTHAIQVQVRKEIRANAPTLTPTATTTPHLGQGGVNLGQAMMRSSFTSAPLQSKLLDPLNVPTQLAEPELGPVFAPSERASTATGPMPVSSAASPELARHAGQQMATALVQSQGKTTEIALNPEELGRVRLSLSASDGVLTLVVQAERPETSDLLRRNIEVLAQDFRSLGYENLSFSFSDQHGDSRDQGPETDDAAFAPHENSPTEDARPLATVAVSGLDLRL